MFREAPSYYSIIDLSGWSYNGQAATGLGEGVGCGLALKYTLIVAAIVSKVEIIQQQSKK